jgi:ABC-type transport system involved in multi-copper enzyme maturation permease subunit
VPTARLLAAELLKVRKRWLIYLLFAVMVAGISIQVWLGGYASWVNRGGGDFEGDTTSLHTFVMPWALTALLDSGQFWGSVLVAVMISSAVATEYNWGTARQALVRGQTRTSFLVTKLLGTAIVASMCLLLALAVGVLFSLLATAIAGETARFPSVVNSVLMILRAGYCVLPYALLSFCLAVVGRSTTLGVIGTLLYMLIIEAITVGVLSQLGGPAPTILAFTLGHNVSAVLSANLIHGDTLYGSMAFRSTPDPADLPDPAVGALVIAAYCVLFLSVTFAVFQRRDLGVESGGG